MLLFILFIVFVLLIVLLILLFCSKKENIDKHNQKFHFIFSILENLYIELDYESNDNSNN